MKASSAAVGWVESPLHPPILLHSVQDADESHGVGIGKVREPYLRNSFVALQVHEHATLSERQAQIFRRGVALKVPSRKPRYILEQEVEIS